MLVKILIGVAAVVVVFVVVVALQPAKFRVTRTATVSAPPALVFEQVNGLRNWEPWNPWLKLDPAAKSTYEGPSEGNGAISRWAGNKNVGEGSMTIIESRPTDLIRLRLDFLKPFKGTSTAEFTFKPDGDKTIVTWSMDGQNNFIAKAMHLFINMDKMIGGQFEQGLASLAAVAEANAKP
jgi:uncharacterized protein YndB with AHSA1/START domain